MLTVMMMMMILVVMMLLLFAVGATLDCCAALYDYPFVTGGDWFAHVLLSDALCFLGCFWSVSVSVSVYVCV